MNWKMRLAIAVTGAWVTYGLLFSNAVHSVMSSGRAMPTIFAPHIHENQMLLWVVLPATLWGAWWVWRGFKSSNKQDD
ncbi:MAG: hypothetical protein ACYTGS_02610 [Planctomycetota bacterium]|jgi:hypothetical protein